MFQILKWCKLVKGWWWCEQTRNTPIGFDISASYRLQYASQKVWPERWFPVMSHTQFDCLHVYRTVFDATAIDQRSFLDILHEINHVYSVKVMNMCAFEDRLSSRITIHHHKALSQSINFIKSYNRSTCAKCNPKHPYLSDQWSSELSFWWYRAA